MSNENLPAVPETAAEELAIAKDTRVHSTGPLAYLLDTDLFEHLWRVSKAYSRSMMVPDHFKGKHDDCFVITQLALRLEVDPFMLMQNMYIVHGRPGMEAKLAIALCNSRGPFSDRIQWRFTGEGKNRACTAFAHDRQSGETCEATVSWAMVEAEGWSKDKKGIKSKWVTMPDVMFRYRSAMFLIRMYCPEVLMGMQTTEELEDITINVRSTNAPSVSGNVEKMLENAKGSNAEPPLREPGDEPEEDEATAVASWIGDLESLDSLTALAQARKNIPKEWSDDSRQRASNAIDMREVAIRSSRGSGSNKSNMMFDKQQSATEAGK